MSGEGAAGAIEPRSLAIVGRELAIAWADGHESYLPFDALRRICPCARCKTEAARAPSASPLRLVRAPAQGEIVSERWGPVGSYAVQIVWSDGHHDGIYTFDLLRRSCPCPECSPP